MNKMFIALVLTLILSPAVWADECGCCTTGCCFDNYTPARLYLSHVEGDNIAYREGYTSIGLFTSPSGGGNCKPFLDLRGHVFNNGKIAGNLGGGLRGYSSSLNKVFGINSYYDFREGPSHYYHQVGGGVEILGPCLDLRLNGYFPVGRKDGESGRRRFNFPKGLFATCRKRQEALAGFDAEIGRCFSFCLPCSCSSFCFYLAAGPYYYEAKGCRDKNIWGGQARLMTQCDCCTMSDSLRFEVGGSYDQFYRFSGYARVEISVPFYWPGSGCHSCDCCGLICQPVHRQEMIVLNKRHCSWETNFSTNSRIHQFSGPESGLLQGYIFPWPKLAP